jgi:hypothetical protein
MHMSILDQPIPREAWLSIGAIFPPEPPKRVVKKRSKGGVPKEVRRRQMREAYLRFRAKKLANKQ